MELIQIVLLLNFLLCCWRLIATLRMKRLISGVWFLTSYFAICMMVFGADTPIKHHANFSGSMWTIQLESIHSNIIFVLFFNTLLAVGEIVTNFFMRRTVPDIKHIKPIQHALLERLNLIYGLMLVIGGCLYGIKMWGLGYSDYVEYKSSNWPAVIFLSSAPFITISFVLRRYLFGVLGVLFFIYFAISLQVRSFVLFSVMPAAVIIILIHFHGKSISIWNSFKRLGMPVMLILLLASFGAYLIYQRTGKLYLPESGLPIGMHIIMDKIRHGAATVEWNSFKVMLQGLAMPILKIFKIDFGVKFDTPAYFASIYEGFWGKTERYFHYPVLWYADAYAAFRDWGLLIGLFWGILLAVVERLVVQSLLTFCIFIPYYVWMAYFLVRGAIGNAFLSISYEVYLNLVMLVFILLFLRHRTEGKPTNTDVISSHQ